jgi:hypothetical protein
LFFLDTGFCRKSFYYVRAPIEKGKPNDKYIAQSDSAVARGGGWRRSRLLPLPAAAAAAVHRNLYDQGYV